MTRLLTVALILAVVACVFAAPGHVVGRVATYSATASGGSIALAHLEGGYFGAGTLSIGHGGSSGGCGHAGHGGNHGVNSYGGPAGDTGHTSYV